MELLKPAANTRPHIIRISSLGGGDDDDDDGLKSKNDSGLRNPPRLKKDIQCQIVNSSIGHDIKCEKDGRDRVSSCPDCIRDRIPHGTALLKEFNDTLLTIRNLTLSGSESASVKTNNTTCNKTQITGNSNDTKQNENVEVTTPAPVSSSVTDNEYVEDDEVSLGIFLMSAICTVDNIILYNMGSHFENQQMSYGSNILKV